MKKIIGIIAIVALLCAFAVGCEASGTYVDTTNTRHAASDLQKNQPTPTDISYSLERYNLIRRAYWVNGQREKANMLPCEIQKPLGYIILFSGSTVVGNFVVDGKVSSLNSFLTPDTDMPNAPAADWLADIDGSYGENDAGIFFFTPDGNYYEWDGTYLYSDIPFVIDDPVIKMEVGE
jgi:hypothetical protein